MNAHNSKKLPVTFELRESDERPAVVRYDGHCLEIYKHRIEYRGKRKYWKDIIKCGCGPVEKCETFASVPLTRTKVLKRFNNKTRFHSFDRSDHIHFWIKRPKEEGKEETMGHFYVSRTGVAWVGKGGKNTGIKSWDDLDKWM